MKICLDPGHGNPRDPGAVNYGRLPVASDDVSEADLAWCVTEDLTTELEALGFEVLVTRKEWEFLTPGERARVANRWGADLLVSIHCNAADNVQARGFEIIHDDRSDVSRRFAQTVADQVRYSFPDVIFRGVKPDAETPRKHLSVLELASMPAILVEAGFISNNQDLDWLLEHGLELARALADGIQLYADRIHT